MSAPSTLQPEERVLSTLNEDGTRRWIKPRVARGPKWKARRIVGWFLIVLFVSLPWIPIGGKPAIFLDIYHREFTFFGKTFLPTDTLLLALFMMMVFFGIFLLTALLGRVWCGWACPQTVYMEWVYRPIERFFEGEPGRRAPKWGTPGLRKMLRFVVYFFVSAALAHTFLSYFVGVETLRQWLFTSPTQHPVGFGVVAFVTVMMLFDFGFFREQTCIVACPYGRFQSVLLDKNSMIVGYDKERGEPRGKKLHKKKGADVPLDVAADPGDCVDCNLCVNVCPTGIDIREGLQLECIACTQCIDACDSVMTKLKRPTGLIRYTTQSVLETGKKHTFRPRVVIYPLILALLLTVFILLLGTKSGTDMWVGRAQGLPYNKIDSGEIVNQLRLRVNNRTTTTAHYTMRLEDAPGVRLLAEAPSFDLEPGAFYSETLTLAADPAVFTDGEYQLKVVVDCDNGEVATKAYRMLGPRTGGATAP